MFSTWDQLRRRASSENITVALNSNLKWTRNVTLNSSLKLKITILQIFQDKILLTDLSYIFFELLVGNIIPLFLTLDHKCQLIVIKQNQPTVSQAQQAAGTWKSKFPFSICLCLWNHANSTHNQLELGYNVIARWQSKVNLKQWKIVICKNQAYLLH